MLRLSTILFLTFLFTFGLEGCAKRATVKPESVVDTPENHYSLGVKLTEEGKTDVAAEEFNRAMNMDPKFAPAYAGMAILDALKGDFRSAHRMVERGLDYKSEDVPCLIAKGRIFTIEKAGEKWLERALEAFDRILKETPEHSEALFYKAEAFKHAHKFSEAGAVYSTVVAKKDDWSVRANQEWELVQKIVRAAPATPKGNEIALIPAIDRADLAVLLLEELELKDVLKQPFSSPKSDPSFKEPDKSSEETATSRATSEPSDVVNHWARNWIIEIVKLGALEPFPDGTFRPDDKITRGEFAMVVQTVLVQAAHDPSLASKYYGETSHFSDVTSSHPAYNAIVLSVNRGIMKANADGTFGLMSTVSGVDALMMIREFQNVLRQTF